MLASLKRAFTRFDTSDADAAFNQAMSAHRRSGATARALRMDVSCGDASKAVQRVVDRLGTGLTRRLHGLNPPIHGDDEELQKLINKL